MMRTFDLKRCTISVMAGLCALFLICYVTGWGQTPPLKGTPENNKKKVSELKEKAGEYYKNADFTLALNYYQEAQRLAGDDAEIKARIEDCQRKIREKKDLLATIPVDPRKRDEYLAQKYNRAKELYDAKKYPEARKEFYELWIIAGRYKKTLSYLEDIDKRTKEMEKKTQQAKTEPTEVAKKEAEKKMAQQAAEEAKKKDRIKKLLQQGDQNLTSGKYEKAIAAYTEALELDKENKEAVQKLEQAKIAQEQARLAQKKEEEQKLQIKNHLEKGKTLYSAGNYQDALKEFQAVLTLDNTHKQARKYVEKTNCKIMELQKEEEAQKAKDEKIKASLSRANELTGKENYKEALKEYETVLKLDKNNKEAREGREKVKQLIVAQEAKAKEEQKLREIEAKKQAKLTGYLKKGEAALTEGNFTRAIENYQEALRLDANNQMAKEGIEKAKALREAKEKELAEKKKAEEEKKAQELAKAKKEKEEAEQKKKAEEERKAQELARAKKEKEEAEQKRKAEEERKAQELEKAKKEKEEAEQKRKAEEEKKAEELARAKKDIEIAQKTESEKEKKELEQIEKIKREQQKKAEDLTKKGKDLFQRGKYEEALKNFEEALQLNPLNAEAAEYKAMTEAKIEEMKRAEEKKKEEERLKKEAQQKAEALYAEALEAFRGRQYDLAEQKATEALKVLPGWAKANQLLQDIKIARRIAEKDRVSQLIAEGKDLYNKGLYNEAIEKFKEALNIMPVNEEASRYISLCNQRIAERQRELDRRQRETKKSEAMRLFQAGLTAYRDKRLDEAVSKWEEALRVYPELEDAKRYLEQTRDEYQQYLTAKLEKETFAQREEAAQKKLNTLITMVTKKPIPLRDFLKNLYIISDIDFYVAEGVEAQIEVKFEDKPLYEVLDTVLLPIGLKWERKPGTDIIIVSPDLSTRVFELTPAQLTKIKSLMDSKFIQRMLWGATGEPSLKGVELTLDERESVLIMVDSKQNLQKMEAFIRDLQKEAPPELIWKSYKIEPQFGEKIKAILEAMLEVEKPTPYSRERRIMISGDELVIKDIPENIKKAEQILMDRNFIKKIKEEKLVAEVFDITPQGISQENIAQAEEFGKYVSTVVENMLYAKTGKSAAEAEGRRLWLRSYVEPPNTPKMTLTVVDYPSNIEAVADLIARLPEIKKGERSEIIYLKYAKASDMSSYLDTVLGVSAAPAVSAVAGGQQVTKSLRVNQEIVFRELSLRLTKVNENDIANENDDSAEFVARTPTTSQDVTIEEFRSEFIDEYEIVVEDIKPSGTPGQGRARVTLRYNPAGRTGMTIMATPTGTPAPAVAEELPPVSIEPFDDLNALLIKYTDPAKFSEVKKWIDKFDMPIPQVSIETKFVEVLENRAKEYSAEFSWLNMGKGIDLDSSVFNTRFGQYMDEFRDELEPPIETTQMSNLLKGTTIFNWIIGGGASAINYQLRLLEAEGIINVVSGPMVTVLNGESADFLIERQFGLPQVTAEGTAATGQYYTSLTQVDMSVTPTVTYLGSITLDIQAVIRDFESNMGSIIWQQRPYAADGIGPRTVYHNNTDKSIIRKDLNTIARVQDGGTIVLGGWTGEHVGNYHSGVPILRNLPYIGQILFGRNLQTVEKTTLLIFLTANIVK